MDQSESDIARAEADAQPGGEDAGSRSASMEQKWAQIAQARAELERRIAAVEGWGDSCETAAGQYACLMVQAGMDGADVLRRLQDCGVSKRGAAAIVRPALQERRMAERERARDAPPGEERMPVCPHCGWEGRMLDDECPHCGELVAARVGPAAQLVRLGRPRVVAVPPRRNSAPYLAALALLGFGLLVGLTLLPEFYQRTLRMRRYYPNLLSRGLWMEFVPLIVVSILVFLDTVLMIFLMVCWLRPTRRRWPVDGPVRDGYDEGRVTDADNAEEG